MDYQTVESLNQLAAKDHSLDLFVAPATDSLRCIRWRSGFAPPVVIDGGSDRVMWGFALLQCLENQSLSLPVLSLEATPEEQIRYALLAEGRAGQYSWPERAAIHRILEQWGIEPGQDMMELIDPDHPTEAPVVQYLQLPPVLQEMVAEEELEPRTADRCRNLSETVLSDLRMQTKALSFSKRRQAFTWFHEIAVRDGLADQGQQELLEQVVTDSGVHGALRAQRYPMLTQLEGQVREFQAQNLAGTGIQLVPPTNFEGRRIELRFAFADERELKRQLSRLTSIQDQVRGLFGILF